MKNDKRNNYDDILKILFKKYEEKKKPIKINIRSIVSETDTKKTQLHNLHKYPAKLIYSIPKLLLNNKYFSKEGDTVLDPFCGSGTTLLEANIANRNAIGIDSNPLATLISEVKTTAYKTNYIEKIVNQIKHDYCKNNKRKFTIEDNNNLQLWFSKATYYRLSKLYVSINQIKNDKYKKYFMLCFSQTIGKVSYADPRIYVPVLLRLGKYKNKSDNERVKKRLKSLEDVDVFSVFNNLVIENQKYYTKSSKGENWSKVIHSDVRNAKDKVTKLLLNDRKRASKVDLVITSPPYAGAQKYLRSSRLSLLWFGYNSEQINKLDRKTIGRESITVGEITKIKSTSIPEADSLIKKIKEKKPERAAIAYHYIIEMTESLELVTKMIKKNGFLIVIIGNNTICGMKFKNHIFIQKIISNCGFKLKLALVDDIQSFGMMTKRNKTSDIIKEEYILIFKNEQ